MFNSSLNVCATGFKKKIHTREKYIFLTDADYNYILDGIERREKNDFERIVSGNSDEE